MGCDVIYNRASLSNGLLVGTVYYLLGGVVSLSHAALRISQKILDFLYS